MGFYVANEQQAVAGKPRFRRRRNIPMSRRSFFAKPDPSKNRVWNFFPTSGSRAEFSVSQPVEPHQENEPTPTIIVSGVRYYGYRYYSPSLGKWLNCDPIGLSDRELLLGLISPRDYTKQASVSFNDIPKDILNKIIDPSAVIQQASTDGVNVQQYANLYGYVLNSPMQYVDTDGRSALGVGAIVIAGTIYAAVLINNALDAFCAGVYEFDYIDKQGKKCAGENPNANNDPYAKAKSFCKAIGKDKQVNPWQPAH